MPRILSQTAKTLGFFLGVIVVSLSLSYLVLAWTEPSVNPPNPEPNISTPLNIGSTGQSKAGGLILNTGGAPSGLIVQSGNVGIGTTGPQSKLEISDPNNGALFLLGGLASGWSTNTRFYFAVNNNYCWYNDALHIGTVDYGAATMPNCTSMPGQIMTLQENGNVGIGTTGPGGTMGGYSTYTKLDIVGSSSQGWLRIASGVSGEDVTGVWLHPFDLTNAGWIMGTNNDGKLRMAYGSGANEGAAVTSAKDGAGGITVQTDGNVGIGTAGPQAKLDVAGAIKIGDTASACDATTRGAMKFVAGAAGVSDKIYQCMKSSNDIYRWSLAKSEITFLPGYTYRRPITLIPATSVANHQVKIQLTSANFNYARLSYPATGQDIRFTGSDGTILQDYWIESWVNGGTSTIWVEVAVSGASEIYLYYNNPSASSASSLTNTFGESSSATSAIPGCTLGQACIVSANQTISSSGTYGYPYVRINSGVTLTVSGAGVIAYFEGIGRFDIQGTLSSAGGGSPGANGGTYWGTGSGGSGGNSNTCGTTYITGGTYGGGGGGGWGGGGCPWSGCPTPPTGAGWSYGGGGATQWLDCGTQRGGFLSIKSGILNIPAGGSITASGQPGCVGRDGVSGGGGVLLEMNASKLMAFSGTMTLTAGNTVTIPCGTGGAGGGGVLSYINYGSFVGTGSVALTAGNGGSLGGGGTATLITPDGTQTGSPSGATRGTTSKTYTTGGSEPSTSVGAEE